MGNYTRTKLPWAVLVSKRTGAQLCPRPPPAHCFTARHFGAAHLREMAKRGKRQKKDGDGESTPAPPPTVHEVTERFVQGQDIASLGRDVDGPFTADALRSRYKAEGTTVDVDKSFSFKSLVVDDSGGGTFSLFGGGGPPPGDDALPIATAAADDATRAGRDDAGPSGRIDAARDAAHETSDLRASQPSAPVVSRRALAVAAARRAASEGCILPDGEPDAAMLMGMPEAYELGRSFVRAYATEEEMVEAWHAVKDDAREDYKRRRRQSLRHQKSRAAGGAGAVRTAA